MPHHSNNSGAEEAEGVNEMEEVEVIEKRWK